MEKNARQLLQAYLNTLPPEKRRPIPSCDAYHFCADEKNANLCAQLVLAGEKRATTSLAWEYDADDEPLPEAGLLNVITDWAHRPQCIIEITGVEIKPFGEVDAAFAFEEGEGDKSLDHWRRVHWDVCSSVCRRLGRLPSEAMPLVLERFKVVFEADNAGCTNPNGAE